MTAKELIKMLSKMPPNSNIVVWSAEEQNYFNVKSAKLEEINIIKGYHGDYDSNIKGELIVLDSDE